MSKAYLYAGSNNNGRMENKVNITKSQSEKYKIGDKIIELYKNERNDWYANQIMVIIGTPKKSNINIPGDKGKAHDYEVSVRTLIESKKEFVKYHKKIHAPTLKGWHVFINGDYALNQMKDSTTDTLLNRVADSMIKNMIINAY